MGGIDGTDQMPYTYLDEGLYEKHWENVVHISIIESLPQEYLSAIDQMETGVGDGS